MFGPFLDHFVPFYGRRLFRLHTDGLWVQGLERAREAASQGPVIFAANHVCWWDGIVMLTLEKPLGVDVRFLIEQEAVTRMPFLQQLGAIGIDRTTPTSSLPGIEAAVAFLDRPGHAVWMYPQGRYRSPHARPLGLQKGVRVLQSQSRATVIPVAMDLGYFLAHLPSCAVSFGEPLPPGRDIVERLDAALVRQLDEIDAWFDGQVQGPPFTPFFPSAVANIEHGLGARVWMALRRLVYGSRDGVLKLVGRG
jgi:1-acyl-sn-glycerol-3-phosphate acyltransferase